VGAAEIALLLNRTV